VSIQENYAVLSKFYESAKYLVMTQQKYGTTHPRPQLSLL